MSLRTNGFKIDAKVFETDPFYPSLVEVELYVVYGRKQS
jgi:hypothetical protein